MFLEKISSQKKISPVLSHGSIFKWGPGAPMSIYIYMLSFGLFSQWSSRYGSALEVVQDPGPNHDLQLCYK